MKLKEAMKKYPIVYTPKTKREFEVWKLPSRWITYRDTDGEWRAPNMLFKDESAAVAWLIEGATPLSPMERACKKWPIEKKGNDYGLGDRWVFLSKSINPGKWMSDEPDDDTTYTEEQAVAYLLEGYKCGQSFTPDNGELKFGECDFTIDFVMKRTPKPLETFEVPDCDVDIFFTPVNAKILIDALWRAGYRPTKESK